MFSAFVAEYLGVAGVAGSKSRRSDFFCVNKTVEFRASCEPNDKLIFRKSDVAHEASVSEPFLIKTSRGSRREVLFSAFVAEYLGVVGVAGSKSRRSDFFCVHKTVEISASCEPNDKLIFRKLGRGARGERELAVFN